MSYSRLDAAMVDVMAGALSRKKHINGHSICVLIDKRDLPYGEPWQQELLSLIEQADVFVFVTSKNSVCSQWCIWELDQARRLSKRLIPVSIEEVPRNQLPQTISDRHLLDFSKGDAHSEHLQSAIEELAHTLWTDHAWLKEHSRLGDRTRQWLARNKAESLLLRGVALKDVERWIESRPHTAPQPNEEMLRLVHASRLAATKRQGFFTIGSIIVAALASLLAGWGELNRREAIAQRDHVIAARNVSDISRSRLLANLSEKNLDRTGANASIIMAIEGLPDLKSGKDIPYVSESEQALYNGILSPLIRAQANIADGDVSHPVWSADGELVVAAGDRVRVWDANANRLLFESEDLGKVTRVALHPGKRRFAAGYEDGSVHLWTIGVSVPIKLSEESGKTVSDIAFTSDGNSLLSSEIDGGTTIFDLSNATSRQIPGIGVAVSGTRYAVTVVEEKTLVVTDLLGGDNSTTFTTDGEKVVDINFAKDEEIAIVSFWTGPPVALLLEVGEKLEITGNKEDIRHLTQISTRTDAFLSVAHPDVGLFDAETGELLQTYRGHSEQITGLALSPNGERFATSSRDGFIVVWNIASGERELVFKAPNAWLFGLSFAKDGHRLMVESSEIGWFVISFGPANGYSIIEQKPTTVDKKADQLSAIGGDGQKLSLEAQDNASEMLFVNQDGTLVVTTSKFDSDNPNSVLRSHKRGELEWETTVRKMNSKLFNKGHYIEDINVLLLFNPTGIVMLNATTLKEFASFDLKVGPIDEISFAAESNTLLAHVQEANTAYIFDLEVSAKSLSVIKVKELSCPNGNLSDNALAGDGESALLRCDTGHAYLWSARTGEVTIFNTQKGEHSLLTLTWDGLRAAHKINDENIVLYDFSSKPFTFVTVPNSSGDADLIKFSHDGDTLFENSVNALSAYGVVDGHMNYSFNEHALIALKAVTTFEMSPDGLRVITGGHDGITHLWSTSTGEAIVSNQQSRSISALAFSRDGRYIVSGAVDGSVHVKRIFNTTQALVDYAKTILPYCLLPGERRKKSLDAIPPRWCITGPGLEQDPDPQNWRGKYPYNTDAWRDWLVAADNARVSGTRLPNFPKTASIIRRSGGGGYSYIVGNENDSEVRDSSFPTVTMPVDILRDIARGYSQ